jgi:L-threonylcarbamoyladenylate synthase
MDIIKIKNNRIDTEVLTRCRQVFLAGGVVMHPTETCYGLAADIFNRKGLDRIFEIKKMSHEKPVSMMVKNLEEAEKYAEFNELAMKIAKRFWRGPVALVLPRKILLPDYFNKGLPTVGIRCPDSFVSLEMIDFFERPLTTTSANISGKPDIYKIEDFIAQIGSGPAPDLILDAGEIPSNPPSTIVAFKENTPFFIREGAKASELKAFLGL